MCLEKELHEFLEEYQSVVVSKVLGFLPRPFASVTPLWGLIYWRTVSRDADIRIVS